MGTPGNIFSQFIAVVSGSLLWACFVPGAALGELVINEFLADPQGTDSGREFVEFLNTGPDAVSLQDVALEFANGALAPVWLTRWSGNRGEVLTSGSRYLVVDRNWAGEEAADASVYLGLQNGPDAIRLVRGPAVLDLVGYGALTDTTMFEGTPAPVVTGRSLSRRPDGTDTGANGEDFVNAAPTPGGRNFLLHNVTLDGLRLEPPYLARPGEALSVAVRLRNSGTAELVGGSCAVVWRGGGTTAWWDSTPPDGVRELVYMLRISARGPVELCWQYAPPDGVDTLRVALGRVQVGAAALRLTEVMPAPAHQQGEWVEVSWSGPGSVDLEGYRLGDEDGSWGEMAAWVMFPGDLVVVAENPAALEIWEENNSTGGRDGCRGAGAPLPLVGITAWPSLNNSPPTGRSFSDRVVLQSPGGLVLDAVSWGGPVSASEPARGLSYERLGAESVNPGAANWAECVAQTGSTPGCPNSVRRRPTTASAETDLVVVPPEVDRAAGVAAVHLQFALRPGEEGWVLRLFNLWGDTVRDFGGDARGPGLRDLVWDGRDDQGRLVEAGALIVWLETRSPNGDPLRREKVRLVVR